jgi:hypothetical protein
MAKGKLISPELEDFLSNFSKEAQGLALELRELVLDMAPDSIEQIDVPAHMLAYGFAETYTHLICVVILQKDYVNLGFPRGVDLEDPEALLEGTGKKARHVKIYNLEEVNSPGVLSLLKESIEITPHPDDEDSASQVD